jgi:tetratricopeptide (TPR) repeat protein
VLALDNRQENRLPQVRHAAIGPGAKLVSVVDVDGGLQLWRVGDSPRRLECGQECGPWRAVFSAFARTPAGTFLLTVARDAPGTSAGAARLQVWEVPDIGDPKLVGECYPAVPLETAAFSPGGKQVVAATGERNPGEVVVWDVGPNTRAVPLRRDDLPGWAHSETITAAVFSPAGDRVLTTSRDDEAVVWTRSAEGTWVGKKLRGRLGDVVERHTADVLFAAFDRDGSRVVTAGADRQAIVWEWADERGAYKPVVLLPLPEAPVYVGFSPYQHQRYVLTADQSSVVRLWDAEDGRLVVVRQFPGVVRQLLGQVGDGGYFGVLTLGTPEPWRLGMPAGRPAGPPAGPEANRLVLTSWEFTPIGPPDARVQRVTAELLAARRLLAEDFPDADFTPTAPLAPETVYQHWIQVGAAAAPVAAAGPTDWHYREANWCAVRGEWEAVITHLSHALAAPDLRADLRQEALLLRARTALALARHRRPGGNPAEHLAAAERDLTDVIAGGPRPDRQWLLDRAEARAGLRRPVDAAADFAAVLATEPEDVAVRVRLADAYADAGDQRAAAEYDRVLAANPTNPDARKGRAVARARAADYDGAFDDFRTAARQFRASHRTADAQAAFEKALALCGKLVVRPAGEQAALHAELGELYLTQVYDRKAVERAKQAFDQATKLDGGNAAHWRGLAQTHERLNTPTDLRKAAEAYATAAEKNPADQKLLQNRAAVLVRLRDWTAAAGAYAELAKREPGSFLYLSRLAAVHVELGRLAEAEKALVDATRNPPLAGDPTVWLYLARVQLARGDAAGYQKTCDEVLARFPRDSGVSLNQVAWTWALADHPAAPAEVKKRVVELARAAAEQRLTGPVSGRNQAANSLNTLGAVLYRAGNREEAVKALTEAQEIRRSPSYYSTTPAYGQATDLLLLAMASYRPDNSEDARAKLDAAVRESERLPTEALPSDRDDTILNRVWLALELKLLRQDAERLINPPQDKLGTDGKG